MYFLGIFSKSSCGVFLLGDSDLVHARKLGISVAIKGFIFFFAIKLDTTCITSSLGYLASGNFGFLSFFLQRR